MVIICLLLSGYSSAYANEIEHLNIGRVQIEDQRSSAQKQAGRRAFEQVLIKLSGNPNVLKQQVLRKSADNFEQFLISSSFLTINNELVYQATFNQDKLIDLLQFSQQAVWGNRRPSTVFWLAYKDINTQQSTIINQVSDSTWVQDIETYAFQRGLEIMIPLGDLDDELAVNEYDVMGLFAPTIARYSSRYAVDYTLVARIELGFDEVESKEAFIAHWVVVGNDDIYESKSAGSTADLALQKMMFDYAGLLASRYAISSEALNENKQFALTIDGIESLAIYAELIEALNNVTVINDIMLRKQNGAISEFEIDAMADVSILRRILKLDRRFREKETRALDDDSAQKVLNYEWVEP